MPCKHFSITFITCVFQFTLYVSFFLISSTIQLELSIFVFEQYLIFECHINVEESEDENQTCEVYTLLSCA